MKPGISEPGHRPVSQLDVKREAHQQHFDAGHPAVRISAVVCAYTLERWDDIDAAVTSLLQQTRPAAEVLLVIDHNDVLFDRATHHFRQVGSTAGVPIRVIVNRGPRGLSGARNTGVQESVGDVVAFLDDDAAASGDWIELMTRQYRDPSIIGVGGYATPQWPDGRPSWMPIEFDWVVGCSYRGQPVESAAVRNFIGCNMSLRRIAFETVGGFSSAVGRIGKTPLGCEETELCIRVSQADPDAVLMYDPAVRVRHRVSADRTRRKYFFRRCYSEGLSKAVVSQLVGAGAGLDSERSYVTHILPSGVLKNVRAVFIPGKTEGGRAAAAQRAGLIVAGLFTTAAGYAVGRLRIRLGLHSVDTGKPQSITANAAQSSLG